MTIFDNIKMSEGERLFPYDDATGKEFKPGMTLEGNLTIARGVNLNAGITPAESIYLTAGRIAKAAADLDRELPWWRGRPQSAQDGLQELAFNMGITKLISKNPKMLSCLHAGDFDGAARELLDGPYKDQVGERATRIANLFLEAKESA